MTPITLQPDELRDLAAGTLSVVWRKVEPQPPEGVAGCGFLFRSDSPEIHFHWMGDDEDFVGDWFTCPLGQPGDVLHFGEHSVCRNGCQEPRKWQSIHCPACGEEGDNIDLAATITAVACVQVECEWRWKVELERTVRT